MSKSRYQFYISQNISKVADMNLSLINDTIFCILWLTQNNLFKIWDTLIISGIYVCCSEYLCSSRQFMPPLMSVCPEELFTIPQCIHCFVVHIIWLSEYQQKREAVEMWGYGIWMLSHHCLILCFATVVFIYLLLINCNFLIKHYAFLRKTKQ